ncbi:SMP-30/gluconolactonase/LRE family protein [Sphingomonas sp. CGMCC 1.13654]|uniref:SMP-30/gluconolactonase/LRE family protein n=1 Tax=Sphingomonas chungangi TaxID=2683589 RepID=A0A838L795_9SPHN|nr:SMP-30/gluconolactonase/LRE family protein [Sphingomonas chungangi]MBA2935191.1 SMP-30/gluconolactonase/LRE family protein [Sphingomonas chungangi]MVW55269.1 SMP-30/gluconolactonase/LRE family protein [Sphingomonas chungangi]
MAIETALDAHATIGESPTWVESERALYWIDVKAPALHRFRPEDNSTRTWRVTSDIGGFALTEGGGAVVALREGLYHLDLDSDALHLLAPSPFDPALFRFNEGACDVAGRFWIGVMFDPLEGSPPGQQGALHSFTLADGLRSEADAAELHNGMAWSTDGKTFFLSHSNKGQIIAFDYKVDGGLISNRRVFAVVPKEQGIPDGAAIDTDNGYWSALHGGGVLRRFHPDGTVDRDVELPVSQPTMPAFAGEALDRLYVTSASDGITPHDKSREPLAGALLRLDVGCRGAFRPYLVR